MGECNDCGCPEMWKDDGQRRDRIKILHSFMAVTYKGLVAQFHLDDDRLMNLIMYSYFLAKATSPVTMERMGELEAQTIGDIQEYLEECGGELDMHKL
ncbi:hypothetical protein LCGC14_0394230 [marine sediment metagenome]|uniref:Uncharacterized protein n=1 Tax=marine sediment metagenome TaxID=412755 RepID=A0A0F9W7Q3_9ZZZZ